MILLSLNEKNEKKIMPYVLVALFLLNILIKSIQLDFDPFWYDEMMSVKCTFFDFGHIKHQSEWDTNPPFYYYCLWIWVRLFGISEFSVRFLSVFFSSLSIPFFFLLAKKLTGNTNALLGSLALSFHQLIYYYSHEARSYSLLLFIIIITTLVFRKFIKEPSYSIAIVLGLFNFLIIYTHYIAGLFIVFQFIIFLLYFKHHYKPFLINISVTIILVLLRFTKKQVLLILNFHSQTTKESWISLASVKDLEKLVTDFFIHPSVYIVMVTVSLLSVFYFIKNYQNFNQIEKGLNLLNLLSGLGTVFVFFVLGKFTHIFISRYILFSIPFIILTIIFSLTHIHKYATLVFIPVIILQTISLQFETPKSMDYKLASSVIRQIRVDKETPIILHTKDITELFTYYYDIKLLEDFKSLKANLEKNLIYDINDISDFKSLNIGKYKSIILCQTFDDEYDNKQIFDIFNTNKYKHATSRAVKGVKITLLKK